MYVVVDLADAPINSQQLRRRIELWADAIRLDCCSVFVAKKIINFIFIAAHNCCPTYHISLVESAHTRNQPNRFVIRINCIEGNNVRRPYSNWWQRNGSIHLLIPIHFLFVAVIVVNVFHIFVFFSQFDGEALAWLSPMWIASIIYIRYSGRNWPI